jgi:protein TonB
MGKIGSFGASFALHAGTLALFLGGPETPQASVAAPTPSPLSFDVHYDVPPAVTFERELPDVLPLAEAELEFEPDSERETEVEPPRFSRSVSRPPAERPLRTVERVPAPEVVAEESAVEIFNPPPTYPPVARRRGVEGYALVELRIRRDGSVAEPRVVDCAGSRLFGEAALEAVREWRYAPLRAERAHRVRFAFKLRA